MIRLTPITFRMYLAGCDLNGCVNYLWIYNWNAKSEAWRRIKKYRSDGAPMRTALLRTYAELRQYVGGDAL